LHRYVRTAWLLTFMGLAPLALASGLTRDFLDWTVECSNIVSCSAFGFAEGPDPHGYIRIDRARGSEGPAIRITLLAEGATGTAPLTLKIDGKAIEGVARDRIGSSGQPGGVGFTTELGAQEWEPFVAALRRGMSLTLEGAKENAKVKISLRGAVAALLNIDDVQGRVGTPTALIRKGSRPFVEREPEGNELDVVSTPLPDVEIDQDLAQKLRVTLKSYLADQCDEIGPAGYTDKVFALDNNRALVGLICTTGADNVTTDFWIVNRTDLNSAAPAKFDAPASARLDAPARTPDNRLTNAEVDKRKGAITFFRKDRGYGDCGASGKYVWTGSRFELASFSLMRPCRGVPSQDWPILFQRTVR
jgi:hypothetical protein